MKIKRLAKWLVRIYFGLVFVAAAGVFYLAYDVTFERVDLAVSTMWEIGLAIVVFIAIALLPLLIAAAVIDQRARKRVPEDGEIVGGAI